MVMIILRYFRQVSPRYSLTREQLRQIARKHGVKRGRNTADTVKNLREAGLLPNLTEN
jgi:hypothetical protein